MYHEDRIRKDPLRRIFVLKRTPISVLTAVLLTLFLLRVAMAGSVPDYPRRPKLVLILVIDQFRYDYLVRFRQQFVEGGFNLLLTGGANFADCRYAYATTATGPGHATLFTGAYANVHGIIGNEWYEPSLRRSVYCVEDLTTKLVSEPDRASATPGFSPHYLIGSTLGDELLAATDFRSKVVAISLKDRASILMGGHSPSAAYWYHPGSGRFVTSTYYMPTLPSWVAKFNRNSPVKDYCGRKWIALPDTPGGNDRMFSEFNGSPNEPCPDPKFLGWLDQTPFMSEIELAFAQEAVKDEHLGQGTDTDMLAISLSVNDYIGHAFGPYSPQVADATLRTDRCLASFFAELDKLVGLKNVWIALSADHGVAPNPEFIQGHKWGPGNAQPALIRNMVEEAMAAAFGPGRWVAAADEPYIYLDSDDLKKHHIQAIQAEEVAATAAASAPGVMAAFTRTQLLTGSLPSSPFARAASNSFNPKRGGDVFVVLDPYAVPVSGSRETTHGSPWNYDSQVPLLLWGSAFRPGVYFSQCQPIDLAATLAETLGLAQPSGSQGSALVPAIR
jgi:predicted AlkP superfamily pyrophosphatase or phosphodiesterase